jgi:hypothetical protein
VAYYSAAAAVADGDIQQPADQLEGSDLAAAGSCAECVVPLDSSTVLSAASREIPSAVVVLAAYCMTSGTCFCFCCSCLLFLLVESFQREVAVSISGKHRPTCLPFVCRRYVGELSLLHPPASGMSSAVESGLGTGPLEERLVRSPVPPSFPLVSTLIAELVRSSFLQ